MEDHPKKYKTLTPIRKGRIIAAVQHERTYRALAEDFGISKVQVGKLVKKFSAG